MLYYETTTNQTSIIIDLINCHEFVVFKCGAVRGCIKSPKFRIPDVAEIALAPFLLKIYKVSTCQLLNLVENGANAIPDFFIAFEATGQVL